MTNTRPTTIGLLHVGDMGAAVAAVLRRRGVRLVSTLEGRSNRTAERCRLLGIELCPSLAAVVRESSIVLSLVPPAAAEGVVDDYIRCADQAPADALFVDLNSIGPELSIDLGTRIEAAGCGYVDAAINGLATNLTTSGTVFLSGQRAGEIAALFEGAARVRVLGDRAGAASAMKMLLAGLSKGLCGLFAELALVAREHDMLAAMIQTSREIYPGMMLVVDRMLPTYAAHAGRRADEMKQLEATAQAAGLQPVVLSAVRALHEQLAAGDYETTAPSVESLIEQLVGQGLLQEQPSCRSASEQVGGEMQPV